MKAFENAVGEWTTTCCSRAVKLGKHELPEAGWFQCQDLRSGSSRIKKG